MNVQEFVQVVPIVAGSKPALVPVSLNNGETPINAVTIDNTNSPIPTLLYLGSSVPQGAPAVVPAYAWRTFPTGGCNFACVAWAATPSQAGSVFVNATNNQAVAAANTQQVFASSYPIGATPFFFCQSGLWAGGAGAVPLLALTPITGAFPTMTKGQSVYLASFQVRGIEDQRFKTLAALTNSAGAGTALANIHINESGRDISIAPVPPANIFTYASGLLPDGFGLEALDAGAIIGTLAVDINASGYVI